MAELQPTNMDEKKHTNGGEGRLWTEQERPEALSVKMR